jgi:CheY-like chemotaxis protein
MSYKVLLVDDDEMIMFMHKMVVEMSGLSSDPVYLENGEQAINYLKNHAKAGMNYLVLLDINMPVMDGWGFLDSLQTQHYIDSVKVIVVSSSINEIDREKALQYEQVIDFIEKPLDTELCEKIKKLLKGKSFSE